MCGCTPTYFTSFNLAVIECTHMNVFLTFFYKSNDDNIFSKSDKSSKKNIVHQLTEFNNFDLGPNLTALNVQFIHKVTLYYMLCSATDYQLLRAGTMPSCSLL